MRLSYHPSFRQFTGQLVHHACSGGYWWMRKEWSGEVNLMDDAASFFEQVHTGDAGAVSESLKRDRSLVNAKNEKGVSAILMACYAGQKEVRDLLLQEGAQLEAHEAVAVGQ